MRHTKQGFTLIEMVVVVLIMGILASIGLPYYYKTIEAARAGDAVGVGHLLANSYRMYQVDHPQGTGLLSGTMSDSCSSVSCVNVPPGSTSSPCQLVACNYIARQSWGASSYNFQLLAASLGTVLTVRRNGGTGEYASWGYDFDSGGGCSSAGTAPICPRF